VADDPGDYARPPVGVVGLQGEGISGAIDSRTGADGEAVDRPLGRAPVLDLSPGEERVGRVTLSGL
jgi:hypothetical protein